MPGAPFLLARGASAATACATSWQKGQIVACALASSACCSGAIGAYLCATRPWCARTLRFWWNLGPILLRYLVAKRSAKDESDREARYKRLHAIYAPAVRRLIGELRGMFAKVAQVACMIPELLPEEYQREFRKLQDTVPACGWDDVSRVLEADLGAPPSQLFDSVRREPLGAASIGQAHLVTWRGRQAVVKVQYPDAAANIRADFDSIQAVTRLTHPEALPMLRKIRQQFEQELDYGREAVHLRALHSAMSSAPEFAGRITVPAPIPELTRGRVLGMEYFPGPKLEGVLKDRLRELGMNVEQKTLAAVIEKSVGLSGDEGEGSAPDGEAERPPALQRAGAVVAGAVVAALGADGMLWLARAAADLRLRCRCRRRPGGLQASSTRELRAVLRLVVEAHGYQMFFCRYFNADPHPGNILALPDGQVGLIDLGQCAEFDHDTKVKFARLIILLCEPEATSSATATASNGAAGGTSEGASAAAEAKDARLVEAMLALGVRTDKTDHKYLAFVARFTFCKLRAEWFQNDHIKSMLQRDRMVDQPMALLMASRAARLLRGFGFQLLENVCLAEAWCPFAHRFLAECNGTAAGGGCGAAAVGAPGR